jgi:hypothetical protein
MTGIYYHCRVELILLPIPSLSPHDEWSNRLKIKAKRAVLPSDAEKSMPVRTGSTDVQILWKNMSWRYVPLQFPYIIKFRDNGTQKKYFEISIGYIFVVYYCRNTISCGQRDSFRNLYVHNL